jgi:hypothetical protein
MRRGKCSLPITKLIRNQQQTVTCIRERSGVHKICNSGKLLSEAKTGHMYEVPVSNEP